MNDLEFEHPYIVQEISETILSIDDNEDTIVVEEEKKTPDGLVLKGLPENLRYASLSEMGTKPLIISLAFNEDMVTMLLEVLKKNMEAFARSNEDIKGINPSVCMHKF